MADGGAAGAVRRAAARLAGVWDAELAARVDAGFRATGRPHAAETARLVDDALRAYAAGWVAMRTDSCEATHVRHDQSAELLDLRTRCLDRRLDAARALTTALAHAPDGDVVDHAVEAVLALPALERCADVVALRDEVPLPEAAAARAAIAPLRARLDEAVALTAIARYGDARAIVDEVVPAARATGFAPVLAESLAALADLQAQAGDGDGAAATLRELARVAGVAHDDRRVASALIDLAWVTGHLLAHPDEAFAMIVAADAAVARAGDPLALRSVLAARRGVLLGEQGTYDEAVSTLRDALALREQELGPDHVEVAAVLNNLGEVYRDMGRFDDAQVAFRRALAIAERGLGPEHPNVAALLNNLGSALWSQGRFEEAEPMVRRSLALDEATFGPDHPRIAVSLLNLGGFLNAQGRTAEARTYLERALAIQRRVLAPDHPQLAMSLHNLGGVAFSEHDYAAALGYFQDALGIFERALSADHPNLVYPLVGIGDALVALERAPEAVPYYLRALAIQDHGLGDADPDAAYPLTSLGAAYLDLHRAAEARPLLERAVAIRTTHPGDPEDLARTQFLLARALWDGGGDRARARALATEARDGYDHIDTADLEIRDQIRAWVASHGARPQAP
ncbi:MAG: tetratricopeptide repeat protein [Kofleriaceae bacterium]|nr:tetratricopeptide repeat protein [Kofleriaceae bacterium]